MTFRNRASISFRPYPAPPPTPTTVSPTDRPTRSGFSPAVLGSAGDRQRNKSWLRPSVRVMLGFLVNSETRHKGGSEQPNLGMGFLVNSETRHRGTRVITGYRSHSKLTGIHSVCVPGSPRCLFTGIHSQSVSQPVDARLHRKRRVFSYRSAVSIRCTGSGYSSIVNPQTRLRHGHRLLEV